MSFQSKIPSNVIITDGCNKKLRPISNELIAFFDIPDSTLMSRDTAKSLVLDYAQNNHLMLISGRGLTMDERLQRLLNVDKKHSKITIERIDGYLESHFLPDEYTDAQEPSVNLQIPKENVNMCFVGGVSTGKSTILNAIFCEQLTQCKIKRTTMVPTVYIENNNTLIPVENNDQQAEEIFKQISEKNQEIIEKTENGEKLTKSDYSELVFNVGKLDINILPDSFVNVYDVPGLNDARTKSVYYEYLEENFHKFNLVIFLVDIHSGLNTSDEMEIVNFITNNTREQLQNNNRKIYTLVVVNKADDMQLDEESNETDKLILTGELSEMYDQVEKTVTDEFARKDVSEHLIGIIPLCAIDAYLYRMVKKYGSNFKLSREQILKIGVNESGKKFSTKKPAQQEKEVYTILNDATFIDTMIKLSGFSCLEKMLAKFLNENDTGKQIRIDNSLYDLRKLKKFTDMSLYASSGWFDIPKFSELVDKKCELFERIRCIDETIYNEYMKEMTNEIILLLKTKITASIDNTEILISKFDTFRKSVLLKYFADYDFEFNSHGYPQYLITTVSKQIGRILCSRILEVHEIIEYFQTIHKIGSFNKETVIVLIESLLDNNFGKESIQFNETTDLTELITLISSFMSLNIPLVKLMRFILINRFVSTKYSESELVNKMMSYENRREIPILNWIKCSEIMRDLLKSGHNNIDIFTSWRDDDGLDDLDLLYLNL